MAGLRGPGTAPVRGRRATRDLESRCGPSRFLGTSSSSRHTFTKEQTGDKESFQSSTVKIWSGANPVPVENPVVDVKLKEKKNKKENSQKRSAGGSMAPGSVLRAAKRWRFSASFREEDATFERRRVRVPAPQGGTTDSQVPHENGGLYSPCFWSPRGRALELVRRTRNTGSTPTESDGARAL